MAVQQARPTEQIRLKRRLFTLEEYERMIDAGVFDEDERIELIGGEIVEMAPTGFQHEMCVERLTKLLNKIVGDAALVWPQNNSIRLPGNSRPEPDLTLLRLRDYDSDKPPMASDVLVVVEVAETSVRNDRNVKGLLYAKWGIQEYWIVNLLGTVIEVYTDPAEGVYRQMKQVKPGEMLALPAQLGQIAVSDTLGNREA